MTDDTIETTTTSTLPKWAPPDPVFSPVGGPEGWPKTGDRTELTAGELPPVTPMPIISAETGEPLRGHDPLAVNTQDTADGEQRRGSTWQWSVKSGRWERIRENTAGEPDDKVSDASADDSRKRLAEHRLFRNGIRSYRVPEWDAGHLSRGVKHVYITERMIAPFPTGDGAEIAAANASAAAYLKALTDAINAGTAQALAADNSVFAPGAAVYAPEAGEISEVVVLLNDALFQMSANSLSTAGAYIGRAIQILEG